ncbi:Cyclin-A3-2 [Platanthera guangdongensis]|uniref:Cyclin-A3-2 n=1 Tax=Platanthera guangdongensis TaxID=2320717 RepID=A0ABR2LR19_9ASPA
MTLELALLARASCLPAESPCCTCLATLSLILSRDQWKYEEISPPHVKDCCFITDNAYTKKQIVEMESIILKFLKFEMGNPTIKTFPRLKLLFPLQAVHEGLRCLTSPQLFMHLHLYVVPLRHSCSPAPLFSNSLSDIIKKEEDSTDANHEERQRSPSVRTTTGERTAVHHGGDFKPAERKEERKRGGRATTGRGELQKRSAD